MTSVVFRPTQSLGFNRRGQSMNGIVRRMIAALAVAVFVATAAPTDAQDYLACPADLGGYLRPLLAIGERGEIRADGVPTRGRSAPTLDAEIVFQIEPGTSFTVVGGSACADGYLWWRVAYGAQVGWVAESSVEERIYYVQPVSVENESPRAAITRESLSRIVALPFEISPARFTLASTAPFALVRTPELVTTLVASSDPRRVLGLLEGERRVVDAAFDATGQFFALGTFDAEQNGYSASLYRYVAGASPSVFPAAAPIVLGGEPPLIAVALQTPYLLTLHADGENASGALLTWRADSGELVGRVEFDMSPAYLVSDSTGLMVAVSAAGGAGAETLLIDLRRQEITARVPEYGVLAWNPYPGSGREQLIVGNADGTVSVYLALPSEAAQPPDIVPARLERLGAVEVFVRRADASLSVVSLALDPGGQLLAVGGGIGANGALPDDLRVAVAFVDLTTYIVSADSVGGEDWASIDQLAFSSDGTALWVGYTSRERRAGLGFYGVAAAG